MIAPILWKRETEAQLEWGPWLIFPATKWRFECNTSFLHEALGPRLFRCPWLRRCTWGGWGGDQGSCLFKVRPWG